jgi:hypothetical protein
MFSTSPGWLDGHFEDAHMVIFVEDFVVLWRSDHSVQRVMDSSRRVRVFLYRCRLYHDCYKNPRIAGVTLTENAFMAITLL